LRRIKGSASTAGSQVDRPQRSEKGSQWFKISVDTLGFAIRSETSTIDVEETHTRSTYMREVPQSNHKE